LRIYDSFSAISNYAISCAPLVWGVGFKEGGVRKKVEKGTRALFPTFMPSVTPRREHHSFSLPPHPFPTVPQLNKPIAKVHATSKHSIPSNRRVPIFNFCYCKCVDCFEKHNRGTQTSSSHLSAFAVSHLICESAKSRE